MSNAQELSSAQKLKQEGKIMFYIIQKRTEFGQGTCSSYYEVMRCTNFYGLGDKVVYRNKSKLKCNEYCIRRGLEVITQEERREKRIKEKENEQ